MENWQEIKITLPEDINGLAESLIDSGDEEYSVLKVHVFETEDEMYDDELIDSVIDQFTQLLKRLSSELTPKYGLPKFYEESEDFNDEDEDLDIEIPGAYSSAIWELENSTLFLAVIQEDREFPITLILGVNY